MKTGMAHLPLHGGKAPRWLFSRMVRLAREITTIVVMEYGPEAFLLRISDPRWFQAFGCVLGFDWHSSGVTTTVGGALKAGLVGLEEELGLFVAGGKGATSRNTPLEIRQWSDRIGFSQETADRLVYSSKMSAKVDSAAVQDGHQIYHHQFLFTRAGNWTVFQQGMNGVDRTARRYHWVSESLRDFVEEPHAGIAAESRVKALDLTSRDSRDTREVSAWMVKEDFSSLVRDVQKLDVLDMPREHPVLPKHFDVRRLVRTITKIKEVEPETYEQLLGIPGVGPKTMLALTLIAELIYGTKSSWKDPARYSFAHGGKDGFPYPVRRKTYDTSIDILKRAVQKAKMDRTEKIQGLRRLELFGAAAR